ncbi:hypothetical protein [Micromonospora sp. NPDC049497]|uniref:hypothetical protein n=1 Tax=Micromonospora sp. NPDC049497 TaxID=3364273 RepID=UPI00379861E4
MGDDEQQRGSMRAVPGEAGAEPDVLLDIPEVSVDSIRLAVDGLDADLSLRARLANLLQIDAGVRVHLEGVELDINGVHAEALLKVRLEKVAGILERALATIDRNPQIIGDLSRALAVPVDDVNRAARQMATGAEVSAASRRHGRPTETFRAPRAPEAGEATEELGQQVGAIGAVADQGRREAGAAPGAGPGGAGAEAGGAGAPPRGTGATGPSARGTGLASGSGGGGEQGEAVRARERKATADQDREHPPEAAGPDRPPTSGAGRDDERQPEQPSAGGAAPSAAYLAEQASETLRQAGRSVWEAIQGGMAHRRQQDR